MNRIWLLMVICCGCLFGQAVEKDVYLTGGWGCNGSKEVLEQYEKAGFKKRPYRHENKGQIQTHLFSRHAERPD